MAIKACSGISLSELLFRNINEATTCWLSGKEYTVLIMLTQSSHKIQSAIIICFGTFLYSKSLCWYSNYILFGPFGVRLLHSSPTVDNTREQNLCSSIEGAFDVGTDCGSLNT